MLNGIMPEYIGPGQINLFHLTTFFLSTFSNGKERTVTIAQKLTVFNRPSKHISSAHLP